MRTALVIHAIVLAAALALLWRVEPVLVIGIFVGFGIALLMILTFRYLPELNPARLNR